MRHLWPFLLTVTVACDPKEEPEPEPETETGGFSPDRDGDGYGEDVDCDDDDARINPGQPEVCNSVDDNCDGQIDEGVIGTFYPDADGDGYGNQSSPIELCNIQPNLIEVGEDCNDGDASINPDGVEICDRADNNCDGEVDEDLIVTLYRDEDGDGYGQDGTGSEGCPNGTDAELGGDCDDFNADLYPNAREICGDGIINNCDSSEEDAIAACTGELSGGMVAGLARAFTGPSSGSFTGYAVDNVGDVDGDGDDDVVVGAPFYNSNAGAAYLLSGGTEEGALASVATASITGTPADSALGGSIDGLGDVDSDGYDDFIVTAYGADEGYLFHGPVSGAVDISEADANFSNGGASGAWIGYRVSSAGDIDNDGSVDLMFSIPLESTSDTYSGAAVLAYGGFSGTVGYGESVIFGETYFAQVGWGADGVGDVDGDGVDDILLGGRYAGTAVSDGADYPGAAYLYQGPITPGSSLTTSDADVTYSGETQFDLAGFLVVGAGDLNSDGYADIMIAEDNQDLAGRVALFYGSGSLVSDYAIDASDASFTGEAAGAEPEVISMAGMDDANGDGHGDVIIGTRFAADSAGAAYLVFGPFSGDVSLASSGLKVLGEASGGFLGAAVSSAGDFDGDGLTDLLVGATMADGSGVAYVVPRIGTGEY
ncbi:MAG: hypothetical protein ACI8S6_001542 [Myxococcota bacterium]|jgi:hypothetical protein